MHTGNVSKANEAVNIVQTNQEVGDEFEGVGGYVERSGSELDHVPHVFHVSFDSVRPQSLHLSPRLTCASNRFSLLPRYGRPA